MKSNTILMPMSSTVMTGTTTIVSSPIPLEQIAGYAIQVAWTGVPVGDFKLQASSDRPAGETQQSNGGPDTVTNWTDITDSSEAVAGSAGNFMWNVSWVQYRYVRLSYTNVSGVGALTVAQITVKG